MPKQEWSVSGENNQCYTAAALPVNHPIYIHSVYVYQLQQLHVKCQ